MLPNLVHLFLTICNTIMFKIDEKFFLCTKEDNIVLEAKQTNFFSRYGLWDFIFLFLGELDTCLQNLISTRSVEQ
jgi:hypothetical protein